LTYSILLRVIAASLEPPDAKHPAGRHLAAVFSFLRQWQPPLLADNSLARDISPHYLRLNLNLSFFSGTDRNYGDGVESGLPGGLTVTALRTACWPEIKGRFISWDHVHGSEWRYLSVGPSSTSVRDCTYPSASRGTWFQSP